MRLIDADKLIKDGWHLERSGRSNRTLGVMSIADVPTAYDLEEQGRLVELPCAVGDTVWQITRNFISEFKIKSFICDNEGIFFYWECISGIYTNILGFSNNRIGKDVFLTKEEAEAKLEELKGE